jgi:hypothetical protein
MYASVHCQQSFVAAQRRNHIVNAQLAPGSSASHLGHETRAARQWVFCFGANSPSVTRFSNFARPELNGLRITSDVSPYFLFCHHLLVEPHSHHITLSIYRILQSAAKFFSFITMKSSALQPTLRDGNAAKSSSSSSASISSCAKTVKATNRDLTRTSTNVSHVSNSCKCPVLLFQLLQNAVSTVSKFLCRLIGDGSFLLSTLLTHSDFKFVLLSHNSKLWSTLSNTVKTSQMSDSSIHIPDGCW